MPISQARIATSNGSRYLQQLCKHWSHKFTVAFSPERGSIDFGGGQSCSLDASPEELLVRAEVPEGDDLHRFEGVIADHIARFAFRETLAFDWQAA